MPFLYKYNKNNDDFVVLLFTFIKIYARILIQKVQKHVKKEIHLKKLLMLLLALMLSVTMIFALASCGDDNSGDNNENENGGENAGENGGENAGTNGDPNCDHEWGYPQATIPATCSTAGVGTSECYKCGAIDNEVVIPATNQHVYDWNVITAPTCTEPGTKQEKCINCTSTRGEVVEVEATGHQGEWVETTPKTCTTDGEESFDCTECDFTDTRVVETEGHTGTWIETIVATCEVEGEESRTCLVCGTPETRSTGFGNHNNEITTEAVLPTEDTAGTTMGISCTVCGEVVQAPVVLPALSNIASSSTLTVDMSKLGAFEYNPSTYWMLKPQLLIDGNYSNCTQACWTNPREYDFVFSYNADVYISSVSVYVGVGDSGSAYANASGQTYYNTETAPDGGALIANTNFPIQIIALDESGNIIADTGRINTEGELVITLAVDSLAVKTIRVVHFADYDASRIIREIEVIGSIPEVAEE